MSWQEGDGPDPADEVDGSTNPLADYAESAYLSAAATWLVEAEEEREKLADAVLQEGGPEYIPRGGGYVLLFESAARLAELNIRMATACGDYQDRQRPGKTDWLAPTVPAAASAKTLDEVAAEIREQVQADAEAHQAETLRPRADPEPEAEGELWTPADHPKSGEWFAYATNAEHGTARWLIVESYAGYLRWRDDVSLEGKSNEPVTWPHLGDNTRAVFRRPTAAERVAFYGPEPDPTADNAPTPPEHACGQYVGDPIPSMVSTCERCGASAAAHLQRGLRNLNGEDPVQLTPDRQDRTPISDGTLQALTDAKLEEIRQAVKRETTRRAYDPAPQPSGFDQSPRPRGGAAQWREG